MSKRTIIVNLFAGAGAGKTTCAWEIASELKKRGIETEYVSEYAKELVWDNNMEMLDGSLEHQQILYHEQKRRIDRLIGKVDVVVTDSPTLLSIMYLKEPNEEFAKKAVEEYKQNQNFNLFINRDKEYQQTGRIHSLQESKAVDNKIKQFLKSNNIYFGTYYHSTVNVLVDNIVKNLNNVKAEKNFITTPKKDNSLDIQNIKREFISSTEKYMESGGTDLDAKENMEATATILSQQMTKYIGKSMRVLYEDVKSELDNKDLEDAKRYINEFVKKEYEQKDDADFSDLENVGIAYTTTEDEKHEIQATINLVEYSLNQYIDEHLVYTEKYNSLNELIENALKYLSFDELVYVDNDAEIKFKEITGEELYAENEPDITDDM